MFSQVSVCLQRWGGVHPPWADTPWADPSPLSRPLPGQTQTPPGQTNPYGQTPPPQSDAHCSGRYASYWNAFLFCIILTLFSHLPLKVVYEFSIETGFPLGLEKLENLEKWEGIFQSGNFEQTGKVREKSGKTTPNTGKLREFQKKIICYFSMIFK